MLTHVQDWMWWAFGVLTHEMAFLLVAIHCLRNRREATSSLLWIFAAWSFPIFGPLAFLSFGINRVEAKGWHKRRSDEAFRSEREAREEAAMPLAYWRSVRDARAARPESEAALRLNTVVSAVLSDYPLLGENTITPLITGDEAFPRMLAAIRNAKHHIHIQTFILGHDAAGREFLEALSAKAKEGVQVRLLYDRFGSTRAILMGLIRRYARTPNFQAVGWSQVNPIKRQFQINLRNHRKTLIVDGRIAFAGGLNLVANNVRRPKREPDRDYHFELHGPIVSELQYGFLGDWYYMADEAAEDLLCEAHFPEVSGDGEALIRLINGAPMAGHDLLTDVFFGTIVEARKEVLAVTPYFVPTPEILRALRSAALRGVSVKLVLPERNNHVSAGMAGRALYEELLLAGVRIFLRPPPFIHAKALIIDDALAIVGTANLDVRSLRLNYESNLAVFDQDFINSMKRVVLEDVALSREIELETWRRRPVREKIAENFYNLLTPIL